MAVRQKLKEALDEFKERHRDRIARSKELGAVLVPAAVGGGAHGFIEAKFRGKKLGPLSYSDVATAGAVYLAYRSPGNKRYLGAAAGMVGATASRKVEEAVDRAAQNQGQAPMLQQQRMGAGLPGGVQMLPAGAAGAGVPGANNVMNLPVRRG